MLFYNERIFKRCFSYKGKYWYRNIKYIPLYFKLMHHLIKYGYDEYATWETFDWFIITMKSVLTEYRDNRSGTPIIIDGYSWKTPVEEAEALEKENEDKWNGIVDRMIGLLDAMDFRSYDDDSIGLIKREEKMDVAKDEFFKLFSEYFYYLWD